MQANADASKYLNSEVMKLQHAFQLKPKHMQA